MKEAANCGGLTVRSAIEGWERATIRSCLHQLQLVGQALAVLLSRYLGRVLRPVGVAVWRALEVFLQVNLSASHDDVSDPFPFPSFGFLPGTGNLIFRRM